MAYALGLMLQRGSPGPAWRGVVWLAWHGVVWLASTYVASWLHQETGGGGGGIHLSPNLDLIGGDTLELWEFTPA